MSGRRQRKHDVLIVGGGPGGSATALFLQAQGVNAVLLEKDKIPGYHIAESLTGECGACLRKVGLEERMLTERHPIKHGVTVYGAGGKNSFWVPVAERTPDNQQRLAWTWQVRRSGFDAMLLQTPVERGTELILGEALAPLVEGDRVVGVRFGRPGGAREDLRADVLIDASGQATFLAGRGVTSRKERGDYDNQVAVFSQVVGAIRDPGDAAGNTLIFYRQKGHWAWFIPLDDDVVSVGVVLPSSYLKAQRLSLPDLLRQELWSLNPELAKRLPALTFVEEVRTISNYSYRVRQFTGKGFLCVGDSHRFIDPIFSFGLYFAVKEAQFAAEAVTRLLGGEQGQDANPFAGYQAFVDAGQDVIQDLMDCFWDFPLAFLLLVHRSHTEEMIDLFAGRVYGEQVTKSEGLTAMRRLLATREKRGRA